MKKITVFNHKGGVSKTTSVYHLGWMLTNKGKRVLIVDADSQCNLTLTAIGEDNYELFNEENPLLNIKSALSPAFESKPELIKPFRCIQVKDNKKLFLLPGSFDITEYEVELGVSFGFSSSFSTMKNLPGSFNYLIEKSAAECKADIVLIDVNPSLSAINQILLLSSDYFIVPTSPDYFSKMALKSIARVLPTWERWAKQARQVFGNSTYPLPPNTPKFLGYTVNDYTLKSNKPAKAFNEIILQLDQVVKDILVPSFEKVGMVFSQEFYKSEYCLGKIPNFHTLQPRSQQFGIPIFELTSKQLRTSGPVLAQQLKKKKVFHKIYSDLAEKIISII